MRFLMAFIRFINYHELLVGWKAYGQKVGRWEGYLIYANWKRQAQHCKKRLTPPCTPLLIHIYKRLYLVYFINSHILLFVCHMDMILGPREHPQNIIFGLHSQYSYKLDYVCIIFVLNFLCNICTQCIYKKVRNNECRKQVQTK